jgi:hypothetical protein
MKWEEAGEKQIIGSFIIYTPLRILLGLLNERGLGRQAMYMYSLDGGSARRKVATYTRNNANTE